MNIRIWKLGLLVCGQLLATGLFLKGYFPLKKSVEGYADISKTPPLPGTSNTEPLEPIFGRLVIILIDALRWDFVLGEEGNIGMPYTRGVIDEGNSISLLATADSPTVTMPRIKALMTGGVPGFVDVVLNFDSTALLEDNLPHQFMTTQRKIVFYGDDTWIRLFPQHFLREEGTTSFFVADYTEVDVNVTRHIDQEMLSDDWDVMILHYLGLDHIGHLAGSTSPLLGPKLEEMDDVVQKIHKGLIEKDKHSAKPSLLLLCGDHGMSEQGSHGGATPAETTTPFIFLSSLYNNGRGQTYSKEQVRQIDLVPTLSLLLGVPVPQNNLGVAIPRALSYLSPGGRLRAMQLNADQVLSLLKQNVQDYQREEGVLLHSRAAQLHARWLALYDTGTASNTTLHQLANTTMDMYHKATQSARDKISATLTTYDTHALVVAIFILYLVFLVELDLTWRPLRTRRINLFLFMGSCLTLTSIQAIWCTSHTSSSLMCNTVPASIGISLAVLIISASLIALIGSSLIGSMQSILHQPAEKSKGLWSKGLGPEGLGVIGILLVIGSGLHVFSLLSSSFIEEEHQTWYFLTTTLHLTILACVLMRIIPQSSNLLSRHDSVSSAPIMSSPSSDSTPSRYFLRNRNAKLQKNTQARSYDEIDATQCRQTIVNNRTYNDLDDSGDLNEISMTENIPGKCSTPGVKVVFCGCLMTLCGRVMRVWNQTGDKWRHLPDVGDWLVRPENQGILSYSAMGGLCVIWALRQRHHFAVGKLMLMGGCSMIYLFRACQGTLLAPYEHDGAPSKGVNEARSVYVIMVVLLVLGWRQRKLHNIYEVLLSVWLLLMCLLLRPHNIPIVALCCIQESCLRATLPYISTLPPLLLTLVYHWMGQASFFYQGNSNSISTVDVSAGYVGLDSYSPSVIGVLMGASTYAGPLFWMLALLCASTSLSQNKSQKSTTNYKSPNNHLVMGLTLTMCRTMTLCVFTVLATLQRYHLFVWTVFSPKLLYEAMLTLVISIVTLLYTVCAQVS